MAPTDHTHWLSVVRTSFRHLIIAIGTMLLLAGLQIPAPLLTMRLLNVVTVSNPNLSLIPELVEFLMALLVIRLAVTAVQRIAVEKFRIGVTYTLQRRLFGALLRLPWSYHILHSHGELLTSLEHDSDQVDVLITDTVFSSLNDLLTLCVGIWLLFYIDWRMSFLAVISVPISAILVFKLRKGRKRDLVSLQDLTTRLSAFIAESLSNILSIKTMVLESWSDQQFVRQMEQIRSHRNRIMRARVLYESLITFCSSATPILILWYGAYEIAHHVLTIGAFVAFNGYIAYLYRPADSLTIAVLNAQGAINAGERVTSLLRQTPEQLLVRRNQPQLFGSREICVSFNELYFRYDGSDSWILKDINCRFETGKVTAITGSSGVGKTSLINLIPQLILPNRGSISIYGLQYNSLIELRQLISLVSHDTLLFSGSISENIALGREGVTKLEIQRAAEIARIDDRCVSSDLERGAGISESGRALSAGQRQRVLIARAILRKPRILILDEGTSCLDLDTERKVINNIRSLQIPVVIIVSHRDSIRALADQIYWISEGQIRHIEESKRVASVATSASGPLGHSNGSSVRNLA